MLIKNSFGCSIQPNPKFVNPEFLGQFRGSSLDRLKKTDTPTTELVEDENESLDQPTSIVQSNEVNAIETSPKDLVQPVEIKATPEPKEKKLRSLSSRTKTKIRNKLFALSGQYKKLTFLTLTFVNNVTDKLAVKVLGKFLENVKKTDTDFEYLWVAERQTENQTFKDNIHFHLITNKFWNIERYWKYWIDLQAKHSIVPREQSFKASSALDVKSLTAKNVKGISVYLTKYVTKNKAEFDCQPWNCSKKVSMLYTAFYTGMGFLSQLERLEKNKEIEIKRVREEYCNLFYYPINRTTNRFYDGLHARNKELWCNDKEGQ